MPNFGVEIVKQVKATEDQGDYLDEQSRALDEYFIGGQIKDVLDSNVVDSLLEGSEPLDLEAIQKTIDEFEFELDTTQVSFLKAKPLLGVKMLIREYIQTKRVTNQLLKWEKNNKKVEAFYDRYPEVKEFFKHPERNLNFSFSDKIVNEADSLYESGTEPIRLQKMAPNLRQRNIKRLKKNCAEELLFTEALSHGYLLQEVNWEEVFKNVEKFKSDFKEFYEQEYQGKLKISESIALIPGLSNEEKEYLTAIQDYISKNYDYVAGVPLVEAFLHKKFDCDKGTALYTILWNEKFDIERFKLYDVPEKNEKPAHAAIHIDGYHIETTGGWTDYRASNGYAHPERSIDALFVFMGCEDNSYDKKKVMSTGEMSSVEELEDIRAELVERFVFLENLLCDSVECGTYLYNTSEIEIEQEKILGLVEQINSKLEVFNSSLGRSSVGLNLLQLYRYWRSGVLKWERNK